MSVFVQVQSLKTVQAGGESNMTKFYLRPYLLNLMQKSFYFVHKKDFSGTMQIFRSEFQSHNASLEIIILIILQFDY